MFLIFVLVLILFLTIDKKNNQIEITGYTMGSIPYSLKYIEEYRKLAIDYDVLDLYDTETFIKSMMRKYGDARIQSIENEKGINKSEVVEGKLDIQSLVGKVIECNTDGYRREVIKMRRVEL